MQVEDERVQHAVQVSTHMRKKNRTCATIGHKHQAHASPESGSGERLLRDSETEGS